MLILIEVTEQPQTQEEDIPQAVEVILQVDEEQRLVEEEQQLAEEGQARLDVLQTLIEEVAEEPMEILATLEAPVLPEVLEQEVILHVDQIILIAVAQEVLNLLEALEEDLQVAPQKQEEDTLLEAINHLEILKVVLLEAELLEVLTEVILLQEVVIIIVVILRIALLQETTLVVEVTLLVEVTQAVEAHLAEARLVEVLVEEVPEIEDNILTNFSK